MGGRIYSHNPDPVLQIPAYGLTSLRISKEQSACVLRTVGDEHAATLTLLAQNRLREIYTSSDPSRSSGCLQGGRSAAYEDQPPRIRVAANNIKQLGQYI